MLSFYKQNKNNGFTLVETLVAISILMISVVGPMVFVANGIRASYYARDQITAFYLAQDAVETLRWLRDSDRVFMIKNGVDPSGSSGWPNFVNNARLGVCANQACGIDTVTTYTKAAFYSDPPDGVIDPDLADLPLYLNSNGYYTYDTSGTETKFKRYFIYTLNGDEISLTVTVKWSSALGGTPRSFTVQENLMLWY